MPKIASLQMRSSHLVDENLTTAARLIEEAASHGAELIVLPEMFAIIGKKPADAVAVKERVHHKKV